MYRKVDVRRRDIGNDATRQTNRASGTGASTVYLSRSEGESCEVTQRQSEWTKMGAVINTAVAKFFAYVFLLGLILFIVAMLCLFYIFYLFFKLTF